MAIERAGEVELRRMATSWVKIFLSSGADHNVVQWCPDQHFHPWGIRPYFFCSPPFALLGGNLYYKGMATVRIVRFSKATLLRRVDPALFLNFARSFGDFFSRNDVSLPAEPDPEHIPYGLIADAFMRLDPAQDKDLIDALYYLDSLSADANGDLLLEEARHEGFDLPEDDMHPVDVAVRVWMQDDGKEFLKALQDRNVVKKFRSFQFCQKAQGKAGEYSPPPPEKLTTAAADMGPVFENKKRGNDCEVSFFDEGQDEIWFVIRHGEIMNRGESIEEDGEPGLVVYRPVTHDVVIYNKETREIRTNVDSLWQINLYRRVFGELLFDDGEFFGKEAKYTLDLLRDGTASLACPEVEEIEWIKLKELVVFFGGGDDWERVKYQAPNLFQRWTAGGRPFPGGNISQASFMVKFTDSKNPRTVAIRSSTKLLVSRDHDSDPVERWLWHRHFHLGNPKPE